MFEVDSYRKTAKIPETARIIVADVVGYIKRLLQDKISHFWLILNTKRYRRRVWPCGGTKLTGCDFMLGKMDEE